MQLSSVAETTQWLCLQHEGDGGMDVVKKWIIGNTLRNQLLAV